MLKFDKLIALTAIIGLIVSLAAAFILNKNPQVTTNDYKVEVNRIENELKAGKDVDASEYEHIDSISEYNGEDDFYTSSGIYVIREINGKNYRIDYSNSDNCTQKRSIILTETIIISVFAVMLLLLLYIKFNIIKPFNKLSKMPYELAKGNITAPINENRSRYFGKFVWGLDMLREELEKSKSRELERVRNEKTLLLSLSHDIKTPLSAMKLYAEAVSKGLYNDMDKCLEAAVNISSKVDEIENYIKEITKNSGAESLEYDINIRDAYMSDVIENVKNSFSARLASVGTELIIDNAENCLLSVDPDRLAEVLQNILDNAMKYGDGKLIRLSFSDEENYRLITVTNSGCTLPEKELPHIFNSFWRGSNSENKQGSGLGLYICRRLMNDMSGEIFAETDANTMKITVVCPKAD